MDTTRRCSIEDCQRTRGWGEYCKTHGARNRKYGDPLHVKRCGVDYNVKGTCEQPGCARPLQARRMCHMHYSRWATHGDPSVAGQISGRPPKNGVTGYAGAHKRVGRARGAARAQSCVDCGERASSWSYSNTAPDELIDPDIGVAYSLDVNQYAPRCTSCHRIYDDAAGCRVRNSKGQFLPANEEN